MKNLNIEETLKLFKNNFKREIKDTDWNSLCGDCDILESIPEYLKLIEYSDKMKNEKIINDIAKIEKAILREHKLIKIVKEDGFGYYAKKGEPYDSDGNIIEDMFEEKLNDEDLFCACIEDDTYIIMKKNIQIKIKEHYHECY